MGRLRFPSVALQLLAEFPDADLLGLYALDRADDAFAQLVARYSRLVWGQCRNLLPGEADAEDAFQATFLVLARSAGSLPAGIPLGPWLHGVAFKVCKNAQRAIVRRSKREQACSQPEGDRPIADATWEKAFATVTQEVQKLPEAQRTAFVLCYIQGRSAAEAAAALGLTVGTVATRLSRARETLLSRMAKHDLGAGALVLCAVTVVGSSAPAALIQSTLATVSAGAKLAGSIPILMHGLTEMTMRYKLLAVGLLVATGLGLGAYWALGSKSPQSPPDASIAAPAPLEGEWRAVGLEKEGDVQPGWFVKSQAVTFTFAGGAVSMKVQPELNGTFSLPTAAGNAIDIALELPTGNSMNVRGIYSRDGDRLRICLAMLSIADAPRPDGFVTKAGDGCLTFDLERIVPGAPAPDSAVDRLGAVLAEGKRPELKSTDREALAARCLKIADENPNTDESVVSLLWVLANVPDGPAGTSALASLKSGRIAGANLAPLARCLGTMRGTIGPGTMPDKFRRELAPVLLERVRRTPDQPAAAELLSTICGAYWGWDSPEILPEFADAAAAMIAERWTKSPDISHFLEHLKVAAQKPWALRYESTVRTILAQSPHEHIRVQAASTLATLVSEAGEARQGEARELFAKLVKDYEHGIADRSWARIANALVEEAKGELAGMLARQIGGPAPALKGVDLDGKPMELADFKGKVVLVSSWATWCAPCMKLIPHERELVERLKGRPFALVGVNGDKIEEFDRKVIAAKAITWRSFQNIRPKDKEISGEWNVPAWPTLFLIDHTGTIRRRWIDAPPLDELDHEVERWVAVAEGKPLQRELRPRTGADTPKAIEGPTAKFIDKIYKDGKGGESKYTVCVPEGYDGKTPLPAVLFLHGSGQVGTDNRKQLEIGFAPAIRQHGMPFPFVGVFPQARESWLATTDDGKRAMAILGAVEREYSTDPKRVYLTGVSMGGEGVWSLAVARPKRFAAIVPVCGGGDPNLAATLKDTPCWAFHGDADKMVPVRATSEMVRAITEAGGRPQYREYRGVGHNCWDRVYREADLYLWLQSQKLP